MHPTFLSLPLLITVVNVHIFTVAGRLRPSAEEIASDYIVRRLFPSHSSLANKLFNILINNVEQNYEQKHPEEEQPQQQLFNEENEEESEDDVRLSEESQNVLSSDEENLSEEAGIQDSFRNSLEGIIRGSGRRQQQSQQQQQQQKPRQVFGLGRRIRRLPARKRGLGHCIHRCINGTGHMNFIQCKSMCH